MKKLNAKARRLLGTTPDESYAVKSLNFLEVRCAKVGFVNGTYAVKVYDLRTGNLLGGNVNIYDKDVILRHDIGYWIRLGGTADQLLSSGLPRVNDRMYIIYEGRFPHTGQAFRTQTSGMSAPEAVSLPDESLGSIVSAGDT